MSGKRIDWTRFDAFLGEVPDAKIAELAGCSRENVTQRRNSKGIQPHTDDFGPKGTDWSRVHDWVGKVPDRVVAKELNITRQWVAAYRKEHGIPSYRSQKRRSEE